MQVRQIIFKLAALLKISQPSRCWLAGQIRFHQPQVAYDLVSRDLLFQNTWSLWLTKQHCSDYPVSLPFSRTLHESRCCSSRCKVWHLAVGQRATTTISVVTSTF